ncbi:MAG: T9SS type A sorting domain-containing protein [Bacteroidales bacterium]
MKNILMLIFTLLVVTVSAQDAIKNVIVETYYISDANDATDTIGGKLEPGSKTYRIYVQLKPGCKLLSMYGDNTHLLKISSTAPVFNNLSYGETFGKDIKTSNLRKNTVALDSWLTLGQTTKKAAITNFGILKSQDTNGSLIGGVNNDGGSAELPGGLLSNNDALAGMALTLADGMDSIANVESNWINHGFVDLVSGEDSTIFGSVKPGSEFASNDAYLSNTGVMGVNPESNQVLVAQLTTKGEISFELNLQVFDPEVDNTYRNYYVAKGIDSINTGEKTITKVSSYLKYPADCGCNDPNFLEYNKKYTCGTMDSCKTRIVLGCTDVNACNYDPNANFNVVYMCCYPGKCYDRDISLACPSDEAILHLDIYPNPADSRITIQASPGNEKKDTKYVVYNYFGKIVLERDLGIINGKLNDDLDLTGFQSGIYVVRLISGDATDSRMFIKK